jgi:taurine dioxygenase
MHIRPMKVGTNFGAIADFDVAKTSTGDALAVLRSAIAKHQVLVVPYQHLDDPGLLRFARAFGPLVPRPPVDVPESAVRRIDPNIVVVSNVRGPDGPIGALGAYGSDWHSDMSYYEHPPWLSFLLAVDVGRAGSPTQFADMHGAYGALDRSTRTAADRLRLIHDPTFTSVGTRRLLPAGIRRDVTHPIAIDHPVTGKRALFLGRRQGARVVGLSTTESEQLLATLWTTATRCAPVVHHYWQDGDLVVWDNFSTLHRRISGNGAGRTLHRTQVGLPH